MSRGRFGDEYEYQPLIEEKAPNAGYFAMPPDRILHPLMNENHALDYGREPPQSFPFNCYAAYSMRLVSFANAAIYALKHNNSLLDTDRANKIARIEEFTNNKLIELAKFEAATQGQAVTFGTELYRFYQQISKLSGIKTKQLALAESFYTWQHLDRPQRRSTHYLRKIKNERGEESELSIEQVDELRPAKLTLAQKKELIKIHDQNKKNHPKWFRKLPSWAQNALLDIVPDLTPEDLDEDPQDSEGQWKQYERCRPTLLRHIPGEVNATTHQLNIKDSQDEETYTSSAQRQGVPSSFNIKDKTERENSATENLRQMLDEQLPLAENNFQEIWGIDPATEPVEFPVLLGGLVTPTEQAGWPSKMLDFFGLSGDENNTRFAREKELAIANYAKAEFKKEQSPFIEHQPKGHHHYLTRQSLSKLCLFNLNVSISGLRAPVAVDAEFLDFTKRFHVQLLTIIMKRAVEQKAPVNDPAIKKARWRLNLLQLATRALDHLPPPQKDRNRNLYLAALYDVSIRLMGGLSTGNCKSSKDRKGAEFMMADAIMIYLRERLALGEIPRIPAFNDTGKERERLVEIFCQLYASGHQLLLAHDNSLGAVGIKDEGILDRDIIEKLQSMQKQRQANQAPVAISKNDTRGIFGQSRGLAELNKPGSFWKKNRKTIRKWGTLIFAFIVAVVGIGLMSSGFLSPVGVIGVGAAIKLGLAATAVGAATNLALGTAGAALLVTGACELRNQIENNHDKNQTFQAQMARTQKTAGTSTAAISDNFGSDFKIENEGPRIDSKPTGTDDKLRHPRNNSGSSHAPQTETSRKPSPP